MSAYPQGSDNLDPSLLGANIDQNVEDLAREHVNLLWKQIKAFLDLVAQELMDEVVADALFRVVIGPLMEEKLAKANEKLRRLIELNKDNSIMYKHYFGLARE